MEPSIPSWWVSRIAEWSDANEIVQTAYIFGSRAKGCNRPNSDLDIAIEISPEGETPLTVWIFEAENWRNELARLLPVKVDLQMIQSDDSVVWPAVQDHGLMVFY